MARSVTSSSPVCRVVANPRNTAGHVLWTSPRRQGWTYLVFRIDQLHQNLWWSLGPQLGSAVNGSGDG
eukprot:3069122-Rhodomonas_salina.2